MPAPVRSPPEAQPQQQPEEESPSEPGPPLPRRPPRRDAPAPPVVSAPSQPALPAAGVTAAPLPTTEAPTPPQAMPSVSTAAEATRAPRQPPAAAAVGGGGGGGAAAPLTPPLSPGLSMYTDLDLLLARLESQENGGNGAGGADVEAAAGGDRDGAIPHGGQHYEVRPFPSFPIPDDSFLLLVALSGADSRSLSSGLPRFRFVCRTCSSYPTCSVKPSRAGRLLPSSPRPWRSRGSSANAGGSPRAAKSRAS